VGIVVKTSVLSYGALKVTLCNFSVNVVTVKRHYRYHSTTASYLLSKRYYCEIVPIHAVITVVTVVLPLSPIPCHPLVQSDKERNIRQNSGLTTVEHSSQSLACRTRSPYDYRQILREAPSADPSSTKHHCISTRQLDHKWP